jgi:hypothetical protein
MDLNKSTATSDLLKAANLTYGGTLLLTNLAGNLAGGDSFKLFNATTYTGAFSALNPATPGQGLAWDTTQLTTNGTLRITSLVNTARTNIVATVVGNQLQISWPSDHSGWRLQGQTNSLSVGISTNWATVPGSTTTNSISVPLNQANPAVFYRLVYP